MLSLAEKYWEWRNRKPSKYKTEEGYTVKKFSEKWAVCSRTPGLYRDLRTKGYNWPEGDSYFKDCLASRETIEKLFGKILDDEEK